MNEILNKRPTFLTVICILTFIYSGFSFLSTSYGLINGPLNEDQLSEAKYEVLKDVNDEMPAFAIKMLEQTVQIIEIQNDNFYRIELTDLIVALLSVLGAFLMFRLDKKGFGLYVFAQLIAVVTPFIYFGNITVMTFATLALAFISLLFIIMYAVNLKHMK